jgi:hypothetical protein
MIGLLVDLFIYEIVRTGNLFHLEGLCSLKTSSGKSFFQKPFRAVDKPIHGAVYIYHEFGYAVGYPVSTDTDEGFLLPCN